MNGFKRQEEILAIIGKRDGLSVEELSRIFAVSKMTIHRDLKVLEREGMVKRLHGGAVVTPRWKARYDADLHGNQTTHPERTDKDECLVCFRPVTARLLYSLILADGSRRFACCAHCGLLAHLQMENGITMAITADFLSGRSNPAHKSHFLMNSAVSPCCQPSILTFEDRELAIRFQTGFGGDIGSMDEAMEFLRAEMELGGKGVLCPHCTGD